MLSRKTILILAIASLAIACKEDQKKKGSAAMSPPAIAEDVKSENLDFLGSYVADPEIYAKRKERHDWVGVIVRKGDDNAILISVRSRADIKKPTCTLDTKAFKREESVYESTSYGKQVLYTFDGSGKLTISTENEEDRMMFFCSGGGTILGDYFKIDGELDQSQVDKTSFIKVLDLNGIGFNVSSIPRQDGKQTLTVFTFGLQEKEFNEQFDIEDYLVVDAETEDLNLDGLPELAVYLKKNDESERGKVLAFSVSEKKTLNRVAFPSAEENPKTGNGYRGHDEFTIAETTLIQRYPLYKEDNTPTGRKRYIYYKLTADKLPVFKIEKIEDSEY